MDRHDAFSEFGKCPRSFILRVKCVRFVKCVKCVKLCKVCEGKVFIWKGV